GNTLAGPERERPVSLVQFDQFKPSLAFPEAMTIAEAAAPSYVRVIIEDRAAAAKSSREAGTGRSVVNGASGTIVDSSGLVVTAAHIALNTAYKATVVTVDGVRRPAEILTVARDRELALLRIAPFAGMRPAVFADSDSVQDGQQIVAIGTPDNKPGIVSPGYVVQAKRPTRLEYNGFGYNDAIKLKVDALPGHSGGPVVDTQGRLIGILASFVLPATDGPGAVLPRLAYAVPSNAIRAFVESRGKGS
ncbi:MAG: trypsin-like peptidase domain-containing protein, partial [Rhodospirillaceae bacterium]|nr:trypsin-like peptidase domain-containing protein [Rhodospirillaceae bacterium]